MKTAEEFAAYIESLEEYQYPSSSSISKKMESYGYLQFRRYQKSSSLSSNEIYDDKLTHCISIAGVDYFKRNVSARLREIAEKSGFSTHSKSEIRRNNISIKFIGKSVVQVQIYCRETGECAYISANESDIEITD